MSKTPAQLDREAATVTIATITDEQIYAAKHHARRDGDDPSVQMMSLALERATAHPAVQIALAYTVDYFNAKGRVVSKTPAQLDSEIAEALSRVTPKQAALASAARNGGKVGTGAYGARDERHAPATIRALFARGLLTPCSGNEGEMAGELTAAGRALVR